ncbi:MAG TPA: nuclear transport factor 2 family protein [Rubrobacter sp.]|jgi:hypothetical protein|nr:nuclear transport factor 2 family protein [Rubrobacter sp.]
MSAEEYSALVRRFVDEVQSAGNIDALDEICSPEFVNHSSPPRVPSNCEGVKQLTAMFRQARRALKDLCAQKARRPAKRHLLHNGILWCFADPCHIEHATGAGVSLGGVLTLECLPSTSSGHN